MRFYLIIIFLIIIFFLFRKILKKPVGLGDDYRKLLHLTASEVKLLNNFKSDSFQNSFSYVGFCIEDTLRMFIQVYRNPVLRGKWVFLLEEKVLEYCVLVVKQAYEFKVPDEFDVISLKKSLDPEILFLIDSNKGLLRTLNEEEERRLFSHDNERWKLKYSHLIENYRKNKSDEFYDKVCHLASLNRKGRLTALRSIYYKAHLFMADKDTVFSLKFYLQYLHVKSSSGTFKYREINKKNSRRLFVNEKQQSEFKIICTELLDDNNLEKAFGSLTDLFKPKKKRIKLDIGAIQLARRKQNTTVKLLEEYLDEEDLVTDKEVVVVNYSSEVIPGVNDEKKELLELFVSNNYKLDEDEITGFTKAKGLFKDQFIESVNEFYYEQFDDLLIEKEEDFYILNQDYYQDIKA